MGRAALGQAHPSDAIIRHRPCNEARHMSRDVDIGNESPLIIILDSGTFAISEGNMFGYNFLSWRHVGSFDAKMATCLGKTVLLQFSAAFSHVSFLYTGLRFGWSGSLMLGSLSEIGSLLQKNL